MRGIPAPIGRFCYTELATPDLPGAQAFYGGLFGWAFESVPSSRGGYHLIKLHGELLGGLYALPSDRASQGAHWIAYVRVASADALADRVRAHGGTVLAGPFDVSQVGRMVVAKDPAGAVLCFWQSEALEGATIFGEPGALCWMELATPDPAGSRAFFQRLLGWGAKVSTDMGFEYTEFQQGGESLAGMMAMDGPAWEGISPHWMAYIQVEDADAAAAQAQALGGVVCVPPTDIPGVGRFAVLTDPQGATISVLRLG